MLESLLGFHIEPTNICTLKCEGCARTQFINQWPQHWQNHSLDIDVLLKFLDIDLVGKQIALCGNYGDPIYHPDLVDFSKKLKDRGAILTITTNGSYKKQEWWEELVSVLTEQDSIVFSVDGTPENFTEYRVNGDWESILVGMQVVAKASCHSQWKYIPFSFNQHDIDTANQLSNEIGIKEFKLKLSDRFDQNTQHLMPDNEYLGERYELRSAWRPASNATMNPKCQNNTEHHITAQGHYSACCHISDHRFYYKTLFGKNKKQYDIRNHTVTEIMQLPQTVEFYKTLDQHPACQYNCSKSAG